MRTEGKEENVPEFCYRHYSFFYVSATGNLRFCNGKRKVRTAETYVSPEENIKTMETLHGFLPEVF